MDETRDPLIGTLVGGLYRPVRFVAEETLGCVYDAVQLPSEEPVTLKVLYPHLHADPVKFARFQREAVVTALSRHPNVLQVVAAGREDPIRFLVYEHFDGHTLEDELQDGPIRPQRAAEIIAQVAAALSVAHAVGIVHRHVRPNNIMIATRGDDLAVKIRDFGFAHFEDDHGDLTPPGMRLGSVHHWAPEYVLHDRHGPESDVYALGIVLFQALTGRPPYQGTVKEIFDQQLSESIPRPTQVQHGVPAWADELVEKFTAWQPTDRPTAAEVVRQLIERTGVRPDGYDDVETMVAPPGEPLAQSAVLTRAAAAAVGVVLVNLAAMVFGLTLVFRVLVGAKDTIVALIPEPKPVVVVVVEPDAPSRPSLAPPPRPEPEPDPVAEPAPVARARARSAAPAPAPDPVATAAVEVVANARMVVSIDGQVAGLTPVHTRLTVGEHRIEAGIPGRPDTLQDQVVVVVEDVPRTVLFGHGQ